MALIVVEKDVHDFLQSLAGVNTAGVQVEVATEWEKAQHAQLTAHD